jgi:hypothetical protein
MQVAAGLGDDAGRYASWAVLTVDGLYYLGDLDQASERHQWTAAGHSDDVIDMAHVRWAGGMAITALDLCAAALGERHHIPVRTPPPRPRPSRRWGRRRTPLPAGEAQPPSRVHDVGTLRQHRRELWDGCRRWLRGVTGDNTYNVLRSLRDPMTHSALPRRFSVRIGGPRPRPNVSPSCCRGPGTTKTTR